MSLLHFIRQLVGFSDVEMISQEIARQCRHEIWDRVSVRARSLSPVETPGYVRARAAVIIVRAVDEAIERGEIGDRRRGELTVATLDAVTRIIASQASVLRSASISMRQAA